MQNIELEPKDHILQITVHFKDREPDIRTYFIPAADPDYPQNPDQSFKVVKIRRIFDHFLCGLHSTLNYYERDIKFNKWIDFFIHQFETSVLGVDDLSLRFAHTESPSLCIDTKSYRKAKIRGDFSKFRDNLREKLDSKERNPRYEEWENFIVNQFNASISELED